MKGILPKTIIVIGIISLIIGNIISYGMNISYAEDLELVGRDIGLEITPESTKLFDLTNLNPGDTFEANLTIENKYIAPFELFMRTERVSATPKESEADLFKQLLLTVYLGDREIYSGSMMDYAVSNISLGKFGLNDTGKLRAIVHLPGSETGNEFQGKGLEVKWIFIAEADKLQPEDPKPEDPNPEGPVNPALPKTGGVTPMIFYGIGSGLIGMGIGMRRKKKHS